MKSMNLNKNRHAELDSASLNKRFRNKFGMAIFLLLLFSLSSCSNVFDKKLDEEKSSDKNTYLMIVPDSINIDSRSIDPNIESALSKMQNIELYGTKTAVIDSTDPGDPDNPNWVTYNGSRKKLPRTNNSTYGSLKALYNELILLEDGSGKYTFELYGSIDSVYFYEKKENVIIYESKTNTVPFDNLSPVKASNDLQTPFEDYGGMDIKLKYDSKNTTLDKVVVTVHDLSKAETEEGYIADTRTFTSSITSYVQYKRSPTSSSAGTVRYNVFDGSKIATGTYRVTFDFYCTSINCYTGVKGSSSSQQSTQTQLINSLSYIVRVAKGLSSNLEDTIDLNGVYSITYNLNQGSVTPYLAAGQVKVEKYTRKSQTIILPRYNKPYSLFEGWYTANSGGNQVYEITHGSSGKVQLYAKWRGLENNSNETIFINPNATYNYGYSVDYGLESFEAAIETIEVTSGSSQNHDWTIKVKGSLSGAHKIDDSDYDFQQYAKSHTIEGLSELENGVPQDIFDGEMSSAVTNGAVLSVETKNPVTIKNLKITGGNNDNSGTVKGGGIYVGSTATVILGDGALITGNTVSSGSGRGVYCDGTLKIKGSAVVEDDIYLASGKKLIIAGPLTSGVATIATITPAEYTEGTVVLEAASGSEVTLDSALVGKFRVPDADGCEWEINTEGKLVSYNTVTFNSNGGSEVTSQRVRSGQKASDPGQPFKSGATFYAWYTSTDGGITLSTEFDFDSTPITSNITLYAKWVNM